MKALWHSAGMVELTWPQLVFGSLGLVIFGFVLGGILVGRNVDKPVAQAVGRTRKERDP